MEKYLLPHPAPAPILSEQKKYRRDSASGIDQFFGDGDGLPYSINMNVFLPDVTHLRTGLYKQQRPTVTHIKTEPDAIFSQQNDTAPSQALPEFTSIFSSHQNTDVNSVFIKQELPSPELHLPMNTQQGQLYQLLSSPDMDIPNSAAQVAAMNTEQRVHDRRNGRVQQHAQPACPPAFCNETISGHGPLHVHYASQLLQPQQEVTYFPPSPPSSEPGSPDRQAELLQNLNPPASYTPPLHRRWPFIIPPYSTYSFARPSPTLAARKVQPEEQP